MLRRDQLRIVLLEDPYRPERARQVRLVDADVERALTGAGGGRRRLQVPLTLGDRVDRDRQVGNRVVPGVLDRELQVAGPGELLMVWELCRGDLNREVPRRLGGVLALPAAACRHANGQAHRGDPGRDPCFRAPDSPPAGVCADLPQGAGEHTTWYGLKLPHVCA